nr:3-ketoacyl-CoA thiolase [Chlamydiota bacterium]
MRKKIYAAAGYNTIFMGPGRPEFDPKKLMLSFESYLHETAKGTCDQVPNLELDEGIIGSFMPQRFIKQGNLPGFLPSMIPSLLGKPCLGVEGACGTGGKAIVTAMRSVLSDMADAVFVSAFEVQNTMKAVYGADVLAGAGHYSKQRKRGHAYFFPGVFSDRAEAYSRDYGDQYTRMGLAKWYEQAILKARKSPKAQEHFNTNPNLFETGMTPPDPDKFLPFLNATDCSKVSDGATSLIIFSEEGLAKAGIDKGNAVEIVAIGEAEGDITQPPLDPTVLSTTHRAVHKAFDKSGLTINDLGLLEAHDCFTISGLLSMEALGFAEPGKAPEFVLEGHINEEGIIPTN